MRKPIRLFYAIGPGNVVMSYGHWKAGERVPSETAFTYSGQFFEFCRRAGHHGYALSSFAIAEKHDDGSMIVENRPKRLVGDGMWYHLSQLLYAASLMVTAVRWRADAAIIDTGTTHWAALGLLRLAGIQVIGNLHNTVWPAGYKPTGAGKRLVLATEAWFWRHVASALMSVSPECERQVRELAGRLPKIALQYRGQFDADDFCFVPPPSMQRSPFRVMYAGRAEKNKGVFDIIEMAKMLEQEAPGTVLFDICGDGHALDELSAMIKRLDLGGVVSLRGRLNRPELLKTYALCHAVVVPTRSDFREGFALVCAEAVLCGRPVITSPVVPAAEVLADATCLAKTDDATSYADAIKKLRDDASFYDQLASACPRLRQQFLDGSNSHRSALETVMAALESHRRF